MTSPKKTIAITGAQGALGRYTGACERIGDVGGVGEGLASLGLDLVGGVLRAGEVAVDAENARALAGE